MPVHSRVTMGMIAGEAGVSKTTVSLALRDHPSILPSTRARIRAIAAAHSYRPDPAISAVAASRFRAQSPKTYRVLVLLDNLPKSGEGREREHDHMRELVRYARQSAMARGYKLEFFDVGGYSSAESVERVLYTRGMRGLIVAPTRAHDTILTRFDFSKFTAVALDIGFHRTPLHTVSKDMFQNCLLAWQKTYSYGYRRIGGAMFSHQPLAIEDFARYGACTAAQELLGIAKKDRIPVLLTPTDDGDAFREWYARYKPEAIICHNGIGQFFLQQGGIEVPGQTAFVSLTVGTEDQQRGVAGIRSTFQDMAEKAVEMVVDEIRYNHWGAPPKQLYSLIEPQWIDGTTLPGKA